MTNIFGIPIDTLTNYLLGATIAIIAIVALLALGNRIFFKIGVRNIPRRRTQMWLIIFALMLSTTLISSVLATGDVITNTVQGVAVYNLGNVDETVSGGHGTLGFFSDGAYYHLLGLQKIDPDISAISAALVETNLLVADETSRQVRSKVSALGIIPGTEKGFGGMQNASGHGTFSTTTLKDNQVYLNQTIASLLNARTGDMLYLYSKNWPAQRYEMRVMGIVVDGGLVGGSPYLISNINTFRTIENRFDDITSIYIANRGGGGVNGVDISSRVTERISQWIPDDVRVNAVKQQGVQNSQKAQDIFSRIFALFSLFALAIGLLLIFLIYVLLAAERRAEMGMARAIGVQRGHLILMFLFEGTVYDILASLFGLASGIGLGVLLVWFLGPILARFNFPLKLSIQPHSLIIAYCLGVVFTFFSVAVSSWLVSRMTVVEAMRDLPEPGQNALSLGEVCLRLVSLLGNLFSRKRLQVRTQRLRRILLEQIPDTLIGLFRSLISLGFLPLLVGYWVMQQGLEQTQIAYFSLGLSLIVLGIGLILKALVQYVLHYSSTLRSKLPRSSGKKRQPSVLRQRAIANKIFAALAGLTLVAYWALPFDALARLGLPRFYGGIEIFFLAGFMMVLGTTWVLLTNAELLIRPLLWLCTRLPGLYILTQLASAYPLHRRFRTGLSVVMFSLVVFAMTVMAVITNAMQNTYVNIDTQTGGYDIQAVSYFKPIPDIQATLLQHGINPHAFSTIGVQTSTAVGIIQLSNSSPSWKIYPAQIISGGFLHGYGLHLSARAQGFNSDSAIWQALQAHPNYALIDSNALPYRPDSISSAPVYDPNSPSPADASIPVQPPGFNSPYTFAASGIYQGDTNFPATPVWVTGVHIDSPTSAPSSFTPAVKLTIIGIVDNSDSSHFGLYIPSAAYQGTIVDPATPNNQTYYFKVAPGQDKRALSFAIGSALLDYGTETTVLEDAIWQVRGPRIFLSNVLLAVVGLTLLLGVIALAITGTRAVIERRQQIGMMRALGCGRRLLQGSFLLESFLVGATGSILGVVLGLILSNNIFAANFFEQFNTGLTFSIPWQELGLIVGVALLASFLGALLPAWQAGRISPAEAIRYS